MLITNVKLNSLFAFKSNQSIESKKPMQPHLQVVLNPNIDEDYFVKQVDALDIDRIRDLRIKNFRLIDSNSVRGVCLTGAKPELLSELKSAGIRTIIDLRREADPSSKYAKKCRFVGLEYFPMPTNDTMPLFTRFGKAEAKDVENLSTYFQLMNRGQVYMGCQLGLHRTDLAVTLNYLLNPNEPATPPSLTHMFMKSETNVTNIRINAVKNLFNNLSQGAKETLGIGGEFLTTLNSRISKLRMMNLR